MDTADMRDAMPQSGQVAGVPDAETHRVCVSTHHAAGHDRIRMKELAWRELGEARPDSRTST